MANIDIARTFGDIGLSPFSMSTSSDASTPMSAGASVASCPDLERMLFPITVDVRSANRWMRNSFATSVSSASSGSVAALAGCDAEDVTQSSDRHDGKPSVDAMLDPGFRQRALGCGRKAGMYLWWTTKH